MLNHFARLPMEEQQRILEACTEEFAEKGYERASTNAIVKRAGIPKGTLFYFFGSKKNLYLYVLDAAVARFVEFNDQFAEELPADLFERLMHRGRIRFEFAAQEPRLYRLFYNAFINTSDEIKAELPKRYAAYSAASLERAQAGLDRTKFKEGIDVDKAIRLVYVVLEGIFNQYANRFSQLQPEESLALVERITEECKGYFELLKTGIYKSASVVGPPVLQEQV
jgi:AcrR family transcriptional regulator